MALWQREIAGQERHGESRKVSPFFCSVRATQHSLGRLGMKVSLEIHSTALARRCEAKS